MHTAGAKVPLSLLLGAVDTPVATSLPAEPELEGHVALTWSGGLLHRSLLEAALASLPDGVMRVKGVVVLDDASEVRTVVQRVGSRLRLERGRPWDDERPSSRLVAVARAGEVDDASLARLLDLAAMSVPS